MPFELSTRPVSMYLVNGVSIFWKNTVDFPANFAKIDMKKCTVGKFVVVVVDPCKNG